MDANEVTILAKGCSKYVIKSLEGIAMGGLERMHLKPSEGIVWRGMQGSKPSESVVYKRLEGPICAQNVRRDRLDLGRLDIPNGKFWYNFDQFRIQAAQMFEFCLFRYFGPFRAQATYTLVLSNFACRIQAFIQSE